MLHEALALAEAVGDRTGAAKASRELGFVDVQAGRRGRAEVDRVEGRADSAADRFASAFALACQLGDSCWEGMAGRGAGLVQADAGDWALALDWLVDAESRCIRWPDAYLWVRAYVLDARCEVAVLTDDPRPSRAEWCRTSGGAGRDRSGQRPDL